MSKKKTVDGEEAKLSFISDLNPAKDLWNMKARIIRKWPKFGRLEIILIDEKGDKIQAYVKNHLLTQFNPQVEEDDVVILSNFGVGENNEDYKVIPHQYKVIFYRSTTVVRVHGWQGVEYGFNLLPFKDVLKREATERMTVDVGGSVIWCSDLDVFGRPPNESKRINFDLQNLEGTIIRCTVWNRYAQQFHDFIAQNNSSEHVMAVIQHAKVKEWRDQFTVQSDKHATRIFLNEELDEVNQLRRSLIAKQCQSGGSTSQTKLSSQTVYPLYEEFVKETPKKTVDEVCEIEEIVDVVVVATIKIVEEDQGWFYAACRKCFKKVQTKSEYLETAKKVKEDLLKLPASALICPKCECEAKSITTKFKVQVRVQDETGSLSFVLFDRDVMKMVGTSATDVRERQLKAGETGSFPHEISRMLEKKLAFKIEISEYNIDKEYNVFTVQKTCDDPVILAELLQPDGDDNETTNEVTQQDDSQKVAKDVVSVTEDSGVVDALKDSATSPNGKQAVEDVKPEEKSADLSSTNKRARKKSVKFNN